jgi:hypothetical protein
MLTSSLYFVGKNKKAVGNYLYFIYVQVLRKSDASKKYFLKDILIK